jgi:hypothetical protein
MISQTFVLPKGQGHSFKNHSFEFLPKQANKRIGHPRGSIFELFIALLT